MVSRQFRTAAGFVFFVGAVALCFAARLTSFGYLSTWIWPAKPLDSGDSNLFRSWALHQGWTMHHVFPNCSTPFGNSRAPATSAADTIDPTKIATTLIPPQTGMRAVIVQVPRTKGELSARDAPRITFNMEYARFHGYGFEVCYEQDLLLVEEIRRFKAFHLMKPHCMSATLRKYAGSAVQWALLLDSDAMINPARFEEPLTIDVLAHIQDTTTLVIPGNIKFDGCSGVFAMRTSLYGLCVASLWCREVANNEYGLWDQSALWSTITSMWEHDVFVTGVTAESCCWNQAHRWQNKALHAPEVESSWEATMKAALGSLDGAKASEKGGVLPSPGFARIYGRHVGDAAGFVWHPAGGGKLRKGDILRAKAAFKLRNGQSWIKHPIMRAKLQSYGQV